MTNSAAGKRADRAFTVPCPGEQFFHRYEHKRLRSSACDRLPQKGKHILKVSIEADYVNLDKIEFKAVNEHPTGVENIILQEAEQEYNIYTMQGIYLKTIKVTENAITDKLRNLKFNTGAYIAKRKEGGKSFIVIVD